MSRLVSPELFEALRQWRTALFMLAYTGGAPTSDAHKAKKAKAWAIEQGAAVRVAVLLGEPDALARTKESRRERRSPQATGVSNEAKEK